MENKKFWFFGSKLNTVLLLILIILMVIALKWMNENKEMYGLKGIKKLVVEEIQHESRSKASWDNVSFQYPSTWKIENYYDKKSKKQIGFLLQGPASENQIITVTTQGIEFVDSGFAHIENSHGLSFVAANGIFKQNKDIFSKIVSSAN